MQGVALWASILLAVVFATAAASKFADQAGTHQALADFGMPSRSLKALSVLLPLAELAIAVALLFRPTARWAAIGALALLVVFMVAIARAMARGEAPDCHCFGQISSSPVAPEQAPTPGPRAGQRSIGSVPAWAPGRRAGPAILAAEHRWRDHHARRPDRSRQAGGPRLRQPRVRSMRGHVRGSRPLAEYAGRPDNDRTSGHGEEGAAPRGHKRPPSEQCAGPEGLRGLPRVPRGGHPIGCDRGGGRQCGQPDALDAGPRRDIGQARGTGPRGRLAATICGERSTVRGAAVVQRGGSHCLKPTEWKARATPSRTSRRGLVRRLARRGSMWRRWRSWTPAAR